MTQIEKLISSMNDCLQLIDGKEMQLYHSLRGKSEMWKIGFFSGLLSNSLSNSLSHDYNIGSDSGMEFRANISNIKTETATNEVKNYIRHYMYGFQHLLGDKKHI